MVAIRNVGAERDFEFSDKPDRYVNTTVNDKHGNRSGILSWAYNDEKGMFIMRLNLWTAVDLRELSNAGFHTHTVNPNCKIEWNFFNKLQ
ncbi:hypothetical protein Hanom_Chr04g00304331 [Helianthus anomalus]